MVTKVVWKKLRFCCVALPIVFALAVWVARIHTHTSHFKAEYCILCSNVSLHFYCIICHSTLYCTAAFLSATDASKMGIGQRARSGPIELPCGHHSVFELLIGFGHLWAERSPEKSFIFTAAYDICSIKRLNESSNNNQMRDSYNILIRYLYLRGHTYMMSAQRGGGGYPQKQT